MVCQPVVTRHLLTSQIFKFRYLAGCIRNVKFYSTSEINRAGRPIPEKISYLSVPGKTPLLGLTSGQLIDQSCEKFGETEALISDYQNIRKNFMQIRNDIDSLAGGFLKIGLKKGDRVGIWGPNSYEWFLTQMAAFKSGLILVNINPAYQTRELLYCLNKVGVKCLVLDEEFKSQKYFQMVAEVMPEIVNGDFVPGQISSKSTPNLSHLITMSKKSEKSTFQFHDLLDEGKGKESKELLQNAAKSVQMDDVCNIQFTSGTTGNPKGVMLTHHNIVNNSFLVGQRWSYSSKDRIAIIPPFFHCFGGIIGILSAFQYGCTTVIPVPGFNAAKSIEVIAKEKCTIVYGTPTMHIDMINSAGIKNFDLSSLKLAVTAGAICPEELIKEMKDKYTVDAVGSLYGLTETSPVMTMSLPEDNDLLRSTTVGYPTEQTEVKIVDTNGQVVPLGVEGEICTRGYLTLKGYWQDPEKTAEVLDQSHWFHTGDLFKMLNSGHLQIVGRIKDMIIRGGENIYPKEVEEFLHTHPAISEAHVFGLPDQRMGEEVAVWIKTKEGQELTEENIKKFCKGQISHYKIPRYISFVTQFPTTTSGKIQKFRMREETVKKLGLKS